jgi:protein-tyrosine kinase
MSVVERALGKLRRGESVAGRTDAATTNAIEADSIGTIVEAQPVGARPSVVIDRDALRTAGYLPDRNQDRRFADEYRQIKRPLLAYAFNPEAAARRPSPRLVMMASALPGDGKTFTSINLAMSLARERDTSVVLVDGDVAKPHISRIFGVQSELGLLDALTDEAVDVESLVLPTDVKHLSILPAGQVRDGATELLASARMKTVTERLLSRHSRGIVLFDSSPLAVSSESRALATAMGQVIVVVKAGHTPRQALLDALGELDANCSKVSLVLNQGRRSLLDGYYGHSYGSYGERENA